MQVDYTEVEAKGIETNKHRGDVNVINSEQLSSYVQIKKYHMEVAATPYGNKQNVN